MKIWEEAHISLRQMQLLTLQVKTSQTLAISYGSVQYVERLWSSEVVRIASLSSGPESSGWGNLGRAVWAGIGRGQEAPKRTSEQCWKHTRGWRPQLCKGSDVQGCGIVSSSPEQSSCQRWVTVHKDVMHIISPSWSDSPTMTPNQLMESAW